LGVELSVLELDGGALAAAASALDGDDAPFVAQDAYGGRSPVVARRRGTSGGEGSAGVVDAYLFFLDDLAHGGVVSAEDIEPAAQALFAAPGWGALRWVRGRRILLSGLGLAFGEGLGEVLLLITVLPGTTYAPYGGLVSGIGLDPVDVHGLS